MRRPLPDYHQYTPPASSWRAEPEFSRIDGFILRLVTLQNGHNSSHLAHGPYYYFTIIFTCLFASPSLPHTLRATWFVRHSSVASLRERRPALGFGSGTSKTSTLPRLLSFLAVNSQLLACKMVIFGRRGVCTSARPLLRNFIHLHPVSSDVQAISLHFFCNQPRS